MSEYSEASREEWARAADHWARSAEEADRGASAAAAAWLLEAADLQAGERVLEVACGAGRVGLQAAEQVGPDGSVVCSDFAEPMVEAVRRRVRDLGVENVEARVLDAEQMTFSEEERFDAALCRMGYMLMNDPARALARTRAALRPGGRLVFAVWGSADENTWLNLIFAAVMSHLQAPPPSPSTPGPFALGDPERVSSLLSAAELSNARVELLEVEQRYVDMNGWWEEILGLGGPLATLLGALPESGVAAIRRAAFDGARDYQCEDGSVVLPASMVVARAERPAEDVDH